MHEAIFIRTSNGVFTKVDSAEIVLLEIPEWILNRFFLCMKLFLFVQAMGYSRRWIALRLYYWKYRSGS
ncbi:hypothetical protein DXN04_19205 [Chitinophaga silvisoli]|uniref:Uncharacterized protein n=1 Tax=Chitinophaga silvisoli TaxID=2291814 RepID=A0A3E1NZ21_9BACT|nr:hypothetical protein DXN04_19205 [Chitinophaga silvisoli]